LGRKLLIQPFLFRISILQVVKAARVSETATNHDVAEVECNTGLHFSHNAGNKAADASINIGALIKGLTDASSLGA
jgi:hypothetical protein